MSRSTRGLVEAGSEIDHFRVLRLLGEGGFGEVYLARDGKLGRKVALKLIHPRHVGSREAIDRFLFEARATARFNHPNIVTVYAVGEHGGVPYVALEYLEGQTLRDRINERRPRPKEALRMAAAIARALEEAHRHRILHRDLKPENVLIPSDGRVRVVDFGLAKKIATPEQQARAADALRDDESQPAVFSTPTEPLERVREPAEAGLSDTLPPEDAEAVARAVELGAHRPTVEQLTLASYHSADSGQVRGTPAYMSPEQWRGLALSSAADVWALGVMLFELLGGKLPFGYRSPLKIATEVCGKEPSPALPSGSASDVVRQLVAGCLDKDPEQRPSAAQVAETLEGELGGALEPAEQGGPFRGLLPFSERDAGLYFGREAETAAFLERLRVEPTVAVVGPSGAGKSSFVHSGVVPRLREQGHWLVLPVRPGAAPFRALANRLLHGEHSRADSQLAPTLPQPGLRDGDASSPDAAQRSQSEPDADSYLDGSQPAITRSGTLRRRRDLLDGEDVESLAKSLRESPERLALVLPRLAQRHGGRVLLLVDQLEELHTLTDNAETRHRFMRALAAAADDVDEPVRLVVTLRDDFLGRVAESEEAARVLRSVLVLRTPGRRALRDILQKPLAAFDYHYDDPQLPDEMIDAVVDEPACLPLLSFAARQLWERRDRDARSLRRADYEAIGGVAGALATHADALLSAVAPAELDSARQLLVRLVTADGTRRTMARAALLDGLPQRAARVLERLTDARLLALRKPEGEREPHFELAHEALITRWKRLASWLDESADERVFVAEAAQAAELWHRRGRRDDEVWRDEALEDALRALRRVKAGIPEVVREFFAAGQNAQTTREEVKERAVRARRISWTLAGAIVLVAATAWVVSFRADRQRLARERATSLVAGARRMGAGAVISAKARIRSALEIRDARDARIAWWGLRDIGLRLRVRVESAVARLAFGPTGEYLWVLGADGRLRRFNLRDEQRHLVSQLKDRHLWDFLPLGRDRVFFAWKNKGGPLRVSSRDLTSGKVVDYATLGREVVGNMVLSPDGKRVCMSSNKALRCWDTRSRAQVLKIEGTSATMSFTLDGRLMSLVYRGRSLVVYADQTPLPRWRLGRSYLLHPVAFSPDGKHLFHSGGPRLRRLAAGRQPGLVVALPDTLASIAFARTRPLLALGTKHAAIHLFDLRDGGIRKYGTLGRRRQDGDALIRLLFDRTGSRLAAASKRGIVRVWDVREGRRMVASSGHRGGITALALRPQADIVATAAKDKTLKLWLPGNPREIVSREVSSIVQSLRYSPTGDRLAIGFRGGRIEVARGRFAAIGRVIEPYGPPVDRLVWSPDGKLLIAGGKNGTVVIYQLARRRGSRAAIAPPRRGGTTCGLAISERGDRLGVVLCYQQPPSGKIVSEYELPSGRRLSRATFRSFDDISSAAYRGKTLLVDDGWRGIIHYRDGSGFRRRPTRSKVVGHSFLVAGGRHLVRIRRGPFAYGGALAIDDLVGGAPSVYVFGHRNSIVAMELTKSLLATGDAYGAVQLWRPPSYLPRWSRLLIDAERRYLYRREDRVDLRTGRRESLPTTRWVKALASRAVAAVQHASGLTCMVDMGGHAEVWDARTDQRLARVRLPRLQSAFSVTGVTGFRFGTSFPFGTRGMWRGDADNCLLYVDASLLILHRSGRLRSVAHCDHMDGMSSGGLFCQRGGEVRVLDKGWRVTTKFKAPSGIYAVVPDRLRPGGWFAAGPTDSLALLWSLFRVKRGRAALGGPLPSGRGGPPRVLAWLHTPLLADHGWRLLALGTDAGSVSIVDMRTYETVASWSLHGPITDIWQRGDELHFVSARGDFRRVDLSSLRKPYCELMRDVWRAAPHVWREQGPVPTRPPARHACAEQRR